MTQFSTATLEERTYAQIQSMLRRGTLPPGSRLRETALGRKLGVSRMPVRLAIRQLEREGLVVQVPGIGSYVKKHGPDEVRDITDLRTDLEKCAAQRAAGKITRDQLDALRAAIEEMRAVARDASAADMTELAPPLFERLAIADRRFHQTILTAAGNRQVIKIINDAKLVERLCSAGFPVPGNLRAYLHRQVLEHYRIYQALRDRDPRRAGLRMEEHLGPAAQRIVEFVQQNSRDDSLEGDIENF